MSNLILRSQSDALVTVEFEAPGDLTPAAGELAKLAEEAAEGSAAAPGLTWTTNAMQIAFLGKEINIPAPAVATQQRVCVVRRVAPSENGDLNLDIVSGSLEIKAAGLPQDVRDVLDAVWPATDLARFGAIERLLAARTGMQIETQNAAGERRRFQLVDGTAIEPPDDGEVRIAWEQLAWRDASQDPAIHKDPADRLKQVLDESDARLEQEKRRPVRRIRRFDSRAEIEGAVFIQVKRKKTGGAPPTNEVRELVAPPWALTLGGADWIPASLVIDGVDLKNAKMYYTDGADAFDEPRQQGDSGFDLQTSLAWNWGTAAENPVLPALVNLASDPRSPLLSTGEVLGGGVNLPFLWQLGKLVVGSTPERTETGVWVRYRLDPLPARDTAVSRRPDRDAGLSRSIRVPQLAGSTSPERSWQLDLGLLPDAEPDVAGARLWLDLQPVTGRKVTLTLAGARIRAAAPAIHVLRTPLADPAAMPNRADRLADLHPEARIILSNDRLTPSATSVHALLATRAGTNGPIQLAAWQDARDVAVAYVPGPVAGLDLVPRTGGNLAPAASANPTDPPPLDRVRDYEAGRVAVHLIRNVQIDSSTPLATVRIGAVTDLFVPASETVAALLPWALARVNENEFGGHALHPYHRNLLLEAFEWSRSAPDRQDAEPGSLPPLVDPIGVETAPRDFRREEALLVLEQAVRDRFAKATGEPLPLAGQDFHKVANWLSAVGFKSRGGAELTPRLKLDVGQLPAFEFSWENGAADLPAQRLGLTNDPTPQDFDWLGAWLRWTDLEPSGEPTLHVHPDGRNGARRAGNSDVPLLEQRTPITAVTAGWLAGRMWVIFAVDSPSGKPKLFAWEPLNTADDRPRPIVLSPALEDVTIRLLEVDATDEQLLLVVVQGKKFSFVRFQVDESFDGPIGKPTNVQSNDDDPNNPNPVESPIEVARIAAQRVFLGTKGGNKTLFVYDVDKAIPPQLIAHGNPGAVVALDVRAPADKKQLTAAVAVAGGKAKLFHWSALPTFSGSVQDIETTTVNVELTVDLAQEEIKSIVIQPLITSLDALVRVFVYASVQKNDATAGRIVAWKLVPIPPQPVVPSPQPIASLTDSSGETLGGQTLRSLAVPVAKLLTDPVLNDDNNLDGGAPESQWLVAVFAANDDGESSMMTWPVESWLPAIRLIASNIDSARPQLRPPIRFGDHEGQITSAVLVPGRSVEAPASSAREARFGAWLVTGGVDGSVRVWDPETGQERFRHTETPTGFWMDTLGVVRPRLVPTEIDEGFWVEAISVPDADGTKRPIMLVLSTLGDPIELFAGSKLDGTDSSLRFICQNLPLQPIGTDGTWQPVPWSGNTATNYRIRHGVYGCCGKDSGVPRLLGVPFEVTELKEVELEGTFASVQEGQLLVQVPKKLVFDAILSNPAELPPDGTTTPLVDRSSAEKIQLILERNTAGRFDVTLGPNSRFDWRFPLTDQLPKGSVSTLPGRLARLEGGVSLENDQLTLQPDSKHPDDPGTGPAIKLSRAEALGRLREIIRVPELVSDPDPSPKVRFREKQSGDHKLEELGNPLPHPDGTAAPIVATVIGSDPSGEAVVLIAAQATDVKEPGSAILADLHTGRRIASYADGLRRARLVVETIARGGNNQPILQRLSSVGVAPDGTVRFRQLCNLKLDLQNNKVEEEEIDPAEQERVRYALPSPAEDVQVFDDANGGRWLLARCRDGSAWLWNAVEGATQYNLSLPDTAVTTVVFGPPIPDVKHDDPNFAAWRAFFGTVSPSLIPSPSIAVGDLLAIVAVGGADGSARVYALSKTGPPQLARSVFQLNDPIQSLTLEIDLRSREAAPTGFNTAVGLVLLACDGVGPVRLIEILSGKSLIQGNDPELLRTSTALRGLVFFDGNAASGILRVIVQIVENNKHPVRDWNRPNPNSEFKPGSVIADDAARDIQLVRCQSILGFAMGRNKAGWKLFDLDRAIGNFQEITKFDGPVLDTAEALAFEKQRFIVAVLANGAVGVWTKNVDDAIDWARIFEEQLGAPMRIDAATLGRVVVPMVACRGPVGRLGSAWAVDLGSDELAWPETLGTLSDETPVAMSGWGGIPHLAVARPGDVTVWNLATGALVHRLGLDQPASEIDVGEDLGQLWILLDSTTPAARRGWRVSSISATGAGSRDTELPTPNVFTNTTTDVIQHARLVALTQGLRIVAAERAKTGPTATFVDLRIVAPGDGTVTHRRQVTLSPTEFEILDAIASGETAWVLLRHGDGATSQLLALFIPRAADAASLDPAARMYPLRATGELAPVAGGFDLDADPNADQPNAWTIPADWSKVTNWSFSDPTVAPGVASPIGERSFSASGRPAENLESAAGEPVSLKAIRYDGRTRLVGVASNGLAIWDAVEKNLVRTERFQRAVPRVTNMSLAAVVQADSKAGCLRFWDQPTGRLRQRVFTNHERLGNLQQPAQLISLPQPARPRLIVSGTQGVIAVDLATGRTLGKTFGDGTTTLTTLTSLSATLVQQSIVIAGIDTTDSQVKVWRTSLGGESGLTENPTIVPTIAGMTGTPIALALHRHAADTLLAIASGNQLAMGKLPSADPTTPNVVLSSALATTQDPVQPTANVQTIRLSPALGEDCVLVAALLRNSANASSVAVLDLPLAVGDSTVKRPSTSWSSEIVSGKSSQGLAVASGIDGPQAVSDLQTFRVSGLLRLAALEPPVFDLPISLLDDPTAFLTGRITPSRRLDLEISLVPENLGLSIDPQNDLTKLTARAALIQSTYSCYLIDAIDRDRFRLSGVVVLWDDSTASSDALRGVLILEDVRPATPGDPTAAGFGVAATIKLPVDTGGESSFEARGPRSRLRAIPFDSKSKALDTLTWSEAISWYLVGEAAGVKTEWHVSDLLLDVSKSDGQTAVVRGVLSASDLSELQGDFLVTLQREIDPQTAKEKYTLSVNRAAYAAQILDQPDPAEFGTTRDDVVYPAVSGGSVGQAFDLVQPRRQPRTADLLANAIEKFSLATLFVQGGKVVLARIPNDAFPLDLDAGSNVTQRLPLQPVDVPQLVHREAHGARIRGRWPAEFEIVNTPGTGVELRNSSEKNKVWLLAPLARTPQGVAALTLDLLARSAGRPLDWTRLQTEGVLAVHRDGGALLSATGSSAARDLPSVLNLLTGTVLRSSGTAGSQAVSLFDDARVQAHALRTGFAGVLVVRTSDARGRVTYRFVNSPYHSLVPLATKRREGESGSATDLGSEDTDPRLLTPKQVSGLATRGTPRFQPAFSAGDRADLHGFRRRDAAGQEMNDSELPSILVSEIPALRSSERPHAPLPASPPDFAGASPFLPAAFELGYFLDKPGAVFHQVVQFLTQSTGPTPRLQAALPTTFVRREPQRFAPPPRAAMQLDKPKLVLTAGANTLQVAVPWTETLGSVPLDKTQFRENGEFEIVPDPPTSTTRFKIKDVAGKAVLQWIFRLGERIETIAGGASLPVPLSPFRDDQTVDGFDLFLVTRVNLDDSRTLPAGTAEVVPMLVAVNEGETFRGARRLDAVMKRVAGVGGGYEIWRLLRTEDNPPEFLIWLDDVIGDVAPEGIGLNLLWWIPGEFDAIKYADAPKVYPTETPKLRDVPYQPQSPRLAAVLRLPDEAGSGLLGSSRREFTLFDGPAASAKGVRPELLEPSEPSENGAVLRFQAQDAETITVADPFPAPGTGTPGKSDLFIVKVFEDGATLLGEDKVDISSEL